MKKLLTALLGLAFVLTLGVDASIAAPPQPYGFVPTGYPTVGIPFGPDLPQLPYDTDFMFGRIITFNPNRGSGTLSAKGTYLIKVTTNELVTLKGKMESNVKAVNTNLDSYSFNLAYTNMSKPSVPRNSDYVFNMLAPLSGTFSNVMFATSNAPPVVAGTQAGTFFLTEPRCDLNFDVEAELIWQKDDGHLGVWFMTNVAFSTVIDTNLLKGFYFDSMYMAVGDTIDSAYAITNIFLDNNGVATTNYLSPTISVPDYDPNWRIVCQKDLDFNGTQDWIWQNTNSGAMRVWYIGETNFIHPSITNYHYDLYLMTNYVTNLDTSVTTNTYNPFVIQSDLSWQSPPDGTTRFVGMADVDNNAFPDFIFKAADGSVFYESYHESFTDAVNNTNRLFIDARTSNALSMSNNWDVVGIIDLNSDGWPDLLLQNKNNGGTAIWFMKGKKDSNGVFHYVRQSSGAISGVATSSSMKIVGSADFNHDGQMDLVVRNMRTGQIVYWYLNGNKVIKTSTISGPDTAWQIVGPN